MLNTFDILETGEIAEVVHSLAKWKRREFVHKHPDVAPLILCPTQYNKSWSGGSYLSDLGTTMDKDIRIMWTGATVNKDPRYI